jgi:nicotinate phosphoribosyltransferase
MPGGKRVWRIYDERCGARADLLTLGDENPARQWQMSAQSGVSHAPSAQSVLTLRHPWERAKSRAMAADQISSIEPLLVDVLVDGQLVGERVSIEQIRAARCADVERLDAGVRQLIEPQSYHVSVSERLWALRERLLGSLSGGRVDQES